MSFIFLLIINYRLKTTLKRYIDIEVERITSHVVNQSIKDINISSSDYIYLNDDSNYSYNFSVLNEYKDRLSKRIQEYFSYIENGDYSKYPSYVQQYDTQKYKNVKKGYLCEISFNSIMNSVLFSNVGPTIPVKITFIGTTNVNIDIKTKEYGINNVIVETYAIIDIVNEISLPITTKKVTVKVKEPITVDIVKGVVPNYYVHS
jgi:sporulation protein YunB